MSKLFLVTMVLLSLVGTYIFYVVHILINPEYLAELPKAPLYKDPRKEGHKKILLWNSWFTDTNWKVVLPHETESMIDCGQAKCVLSVDRYDPLRFDALVFHGRNAQLPPKKRTSNQIYILLLLESPIHAWNTFIKGAKFYNWSSTYHLQSDVVMPYISFIKRKVKLDERLSTLLADLPQMTMKYRNGEAKVAWIVSHCQTNIKRESYVKLLQKHIKVDIFGGCGRPCGGNCHETLAKTGQYKFYLSFENAACKDYITEKAIKPLIHGWIPVVMGGLTSKDYSETFPPHSYIDVRDYKSPKYLANYLKELDKNETAYLEYFKWKFKYTVEPLCMPCAMCKICHALQNRSLTRSQTLDFGKFWDPESQCHSGSFNQIR